MNWVNILQQNDKEFKKEIPKKIEIEEEEIIPIDLNIKNYEDEFDIEYHSKIIDIKLEFKDYINDLCLSFLNKNTFLKNINNNFYNFIKYNCSDLNIMKTKIENENEEYLKQLEENDEIDMLEYDEK